MTQLDRTIEEIINAIETDADVRRRVFEGLGIPTYVSDRVTQVLEKRIEDLDTKTTARFDDVDRRFDGVDRRLDGIDGKLDGIDRRLERVYSTVMGDDSERSAQHTVMAHLHEIVDNPTNQEVLLSQVDRIGTTGSYYKDTVERARVNGLILGLPDNYLRLVETDLVIRVDSGGVPHMIVVEVSTTVDNDDVNRAIRSANLITSVFDVRTIAIVAGPAIRVHTRAFAEFAGVRFIKAESEEEEEGASEA